MESTRERPAVAFDGRVPYPEFASIETTMKCNLQCPMCLPYLDGSTVAVMNMKKPCSMTALASTSERAALGPVNRSRQPCSLCKSTTCQHLCDRPRLRSITWQKYNPTAI